MKRKKNKKLYFVVGAIILLGFSFWFALEWPIFVARGGQDNNVRGWAWSENIGWVSTNCLNDYDNDGQWENCCAGGTDCPEGITPAGIDYGLTYKTNDASIDPNTLSGCAWSENVGWICFGKGCGEITAPDGKDSWACVGKKRPDGSCFKDCGEEFNIPDQFSCTIENDNNGEMNLVAHWKFNEGEGITAKDTSSNENTGELKPTDSGPIWYAGKWDKALKFDGVDDYVSLSGSFSDITQTQEAWIRLEGTPTTKYRITSRGSCGNGRLYINADRKAVWEFGDSSSCESLVSNTILETKKWYHLAATFDNSIKQAKIYINGQLDNTKIINLEPIVSPSLTIGSFSGTGDFFNGLIDNVAIYSRVKSAEEIWDDAHIEISGWAKVESLADEGWLKLKGQTASGDWYGFGLDNWAGTYYTLNGYGWNANAGSSAGIGWLKGGYHYSGEPVDQDNFSLSTSSAYCYETEQGPKTQMFLKWKPALWTESYIIQRCDEVESCPGCTYESISVLSPDECGPAECSYQDGGLNENTGYCWKVIASNSQGETEITSPPPEYLPFKWGKTPLCSPLASVNVDVCGIIKPLWEQKTDAIGYNIYRGQTEEGCVTGSSQEDDSAADIREKVRVGDCQLIGHLGESLDYRGIVGHWTMDEDEWGEVKDSSGEENDGTAMCLGEGCIPPLPVDDGLFSQAGSFDGLDDYIDCGNDSSLNMTDKITVEAWVYGDFTGQYPEVVSKRNYTEGQNDGWWLGLSNDILVWGIGFDDTDNTSKEIYFGNLRENEWNHIAGTFDGTQMIAYVNGVGSSPLTGLPSSCIDISSQPVTIGRRACGTQYFNGLIDNVSVYNRAKSAEEIKIDYEAGRCMNGDPAYCAVGKTCSSVTCGDLDEICNIDNCGGEEEGQYCCYIDHRIIPRTDYYYRITAFTKDGGESPPSLQQSASTLCYPPTEIHER